MTGASGQGAVRADGGRVPGGSAAARGCRRRGNRGFRRNGGRGARLLSEPGRDPDRRRQGVSVAGAPLPPSTPSGDRALPPLGGAVHRARRGSLLPAPRTPLCQRAVDPGHLRGGIRSLDTARRIVAQTGIAMVSLARPLVRQPRLPRLWREGRAEVAGCCSCNRCFVQLGLDQPAPPLLARATAPPRARRPSRRAWVTVRRHAGAGIRRDLTAARSPLPRPGAATGGPRRRSRAKVRARSSAAGRLRRSLPTAPCQNDPCLGPSARARTRAAVDCGGSSGAHAFRGS